MPDVGDLIGDRYRLAGRIAGGGMGEVWRAEDETLNRPVAVKLMRAHITSDSSAGERFRREARAMAALRHPGVADVYDYGEADQPDGRRLAYIVMAYVGGQPLSARIAEVGRLSVAETVSIVAQTARALQAAHDIGVVHRDVKPGNLIIEPDGHVVLVDFGIAVSSEATSLTATNQVLGTALYMAPEQLSRQTVTPAVDVYALGAVAYHCLAGHPPFPGDNPIAVAVRRLEEAPPPLPDDVPPAVRDLVATAMARAPEHRFASAGAMAAAAEAATGPLAGTAAATLAATDVLGVAVPTAPAAAVHPNPVAAEGERGSAGRRRLIIGLSVAALATAVAAVVLADPAGWTPGRSGVPSSPGVNSPSGRPVDRDSGGSTPEGVRGGSADPDVTRSARPTSAPARTPSTRPSVPEASPSATRSAPEPSDEPTDEPTTEPTEEPESPSPGPRATADVGPVSRN
ncbi:protein kinase [Micromonospora krabiensis]|uniref:non-specific serine/threonine protein kinase n=1 Tax=Micromonospora krabiensis TaxID=307121 RepID=A0A1C3MZJ0_9ACTN|nr:serine/threonine-protein kinase [Micromonospora krabiensis]SBV25715.1 serine/threonine protein kinase [Micromonospora krabiensis]